MSGGAEAKLKLLLKTGGGVGNTTQHRTVLKVEKIIIFFKKNLSKQFFFNFKEQLQLEWCQPCRLTQQTQAEHHNSFGY